MEHPQSFLLRCWKEPDGNGEFVWRFSLTHINKTRHKRGFANLDALIAYLNQRLSAADSHVSEGERSGNQISSG